MSKYVNGIMDEVYETFDNHFDDDQDEQVWFLEELIEELQQELKFIKND